MKFADFQKLRRVSDVPFLWFATLVLNEEIGPTLGDVVGVN